jgi:hypothetical protein
MSYEIFTGYPDEERARKWNEFLERASFAAHYVTPNFFVDPFVRGGRRFAVLALDEEKVTGVVTGVFDGRKIASGLNVRPQMALDKTADRLKTVAGLCEGLKAAGGAHLEAAEIFSWEPVAEFRELGFQEREYAGEQGTVVLDLSKGADALFKEFSQTRRNELRRALKRNEVQISEVETLEELRELYQIHREWNARKGNEPDSFEDFEFAWRQKDYRRIFVAKFEGRIIAGSFYRFCRGGVIEYAANNSLAEFQKLRPNDLLGWHSIRWACENGFSLYSMGGAHLFLRRFGGAVHSTYRYKMDLTRLKIHNLKETVSDLGIKTYKSLPLPVREKIKTVLGKN